MGNGRRGAGILSWLAERLPFLSQMLRWYREMRMARLRPVETPLGFRFVGDREMQAGEFEPTETRILDRLWGDAELFVNVGANVGYYCCRALKRGLRTIAFEPVPSNCAILLRNIRLNGWDRSIEVWPVALSDSVGVVEIFGDGTAASLTKGWADIPSTYSSLVPCSTLDTVMNGRLAGRRVLVLMDVEGAEKGVLDGGRDFLTQDPKPVWMVEITVTEHQPRGVKVNPHLLSTFRLFWDSGYEAWTATPTPRRVSEEEVALIDRGGANTLETHNFVFMERSKSPEWGQVRRLTGERS